MRILIATDAWHPQVNGVVRSLESMAQAAQETGAEIHFLTPQGFAAIPLPSYPEIPLAFVPPGAVGQRIARLAPDHIHIATEGSIGHAVRRFCRRAGRIFTTSYHTRFPEYIAARWHVPESWTYAWLRRFHNAGAGTMVPTPSIAAELAGRGFLRLMHWSRGVDQTRFRPRSHQRPRLAAADLPLCRANRGRKECRGLPAARSARHQSRRRRRSGAPQARGRLSAGPFPRHADGRPARRNLCERRCLRVPEPHRHVRQCDGRGDGERSAGRRLAGARTARRHRRQRCRRSRRGFARRLPRGARHPAAKPRSPMPGRSPGRKARASSSPISKRRRTASPQAKNSSFSRNGKASRSDSAGSRGARPASGKGAALAEF